MKRTLIALISLTTLITPSCLPTGSSDFEYEASYLYKPKTILSDTTWINKDYISDGTDGAQYFVDTTLARHFLNQSPALMFDEVFTASGADIIDVDSQLFNMIKEQFVEVLPAVKAIDYQSVLNTTDSVFNGTVTVCYEVTNTSTLAVVMRDTITTVQVITQE